MGPIESVAIVIHVVFAGLWTGSVAFVAAVATAGDDLGAAGRSVLADRLTNISRSSAVLMLLSGGYMASTFSGSFFTTTTRGWFVVAMVVLWFLLMVAVELGASRFADDGDGAVSMLWGAAGLAVLLLLVAGVVVILG